MKRFILSLTILFIGFVVNAQTVPQAKKLMYYERFNSASGLLHSILEKDANNAEAWQLLVRCYLRENRLKTIEDSVRYIPADIHQSAFIGCARGDIQLKQGKKDAAASLYKAALSLSKGKDPAILSAVATANIEFDSGDVRYAIELLNKAVKRDKANASVYYVSQGNAYRKLLNGTEAYKSYNKALEKDPGNAEALYRLGKLFVTQNNPEMYLKYFNQSVVADSMYAPAWYALYYYYYFKDPDQAITCLTHYISTSDYTPENTYRLADLYYLARKYDLAIVTTKHLLDQEDTSAEARLYKLMAYSYFDLNDSADALNYMRIYFTKAADSAIIPKDYETMGEIYSRFPEKSDSAIACYSKDISIEKDSVKKIEIYKTIAGLYKGIKDYGNQAIWLGMYYNADSRATNIDLFNWGLAEYLAGNYSKADTVFQLYANKYPEQTFGTYWLARSNAAMDTTMEYGLAIPHYEKLIEQILKENPENQNKKWLIEAYGYIAAYRANNLKDYAAATDYLEKIITLDPENENAKKFIQILNKNSSKAPMSKNK